jgi:hypothetical protein
MEARCPAASSALHSSPHFPPPCTPLLTCIVAQVHDDIEWLARPVTSLSWFFSLAICHMETARDLPHNFVQRAFWMYAAAASEQHASAV